LGSSTSRLSLAANAPLLAELLAWRSHPSRPLLGAIALALAAAVVVPLGPLGSTLGFTAMPPTFWPLLVGIVAAYLVLVELVKRRFEPRG